MHRRWRAIRLTAILIILIIATSLMLIGQEQLESFVRSLFQLKRKKTLTYWNGVRWSIIIGLLFSGISLIYTYAPSVKKRWSFVSAGSLLATSLTLITTLVFSYWVDMFASSNYNKVYGSIGTVLIIMLLMYINSLILLIGFELNVSLTYLTKQKNMSAKI
jgi:membrane protein